MSNPHRPDVDEALRDEPDGGASKLASSMRAAIEGQPSPRALQQVPPPMDPPQRIHSFYRSCVQRMTARAEGKEQAIEMPDEFSELSKLMGGGLWPGLHILVGNTGSGKSQLTMQLAVHAARQGVPVMYVGLEMDELMLTARMLGLLGQVRWSDLYLGKHLHPVGSASDAGQGQQRWDKGQSSIQSLAEHWEPTIEKLPFYLDLAPPYGWSYSILHAKAEAVFNAHRSELEITDATHGTLRKPFLLVLDYLQLVASDPDPHKAREDLRIRIQQAAYAGRYVARQYNAAVLMVSSTARENYAVLNAAPERKRRSEDKEDHKKRAKRPWELPAHLFVGMGKESGEIEYSADSVSVMVREPFPPDEMPSGGAYHHIGLAKLRAGSGGWARVQFDGSRFNKPIIPAAVKLTPGA